VCEERRPVLLNKTRAFVNYRQAVTEADHAKEHTKEPCLNLILI
jgi:hypothetical protein